MREIFSQIQEWIIHLFSVHCDECRHKAIEDAQCQNCEYLKSLLETERYEKDKLQDYILSLGKIPEQVEDKQELPEAIQPKYIPWHIRRARHEQKDRETFEQARREGEEILARSKSTEELEKEVGIR